MDDILEKKRYFLKDYVRLETDFSETDQYKGIGPPPIEKPFPREAKRITLPGPKTWKNINDCSLLSAISNRKSCRKFLKGPLTLEELSFLLWATQGIKKDFKGIAFRTVPSAGNRHAFETYLCVLNIESLDPGIYRYLPVEHELLLELEDGFLSSKISIASMGQYFAGTAAVVFVWAAIPYRMEWRYGIASHKVMAIDAGHICQNLYLACQAINSGTCAIAAYNQDLMNKLIRVDGTEEFVAYLAPVGKIS